MSENLGDQLRAKREREGLGLRAAAAASGIAFSTLGRIENGAEPSLRVDRAARAWLNGEGPLLPTPPMTLRDWFAGQALPALVDWSPCDEDGYLLPLEQRDPARAAYAYRLADAMLTSRSATPPSPTAQRLARRMGAEFVPRNMVDDLPQLEPSLTHEGK